MDTSIWQESGFSTNLNLVRCAFFDGGLHSRMPLVPTRIHLKLLWHSSWVFTASMQTLKSYALGTLTMNYCRHTNDVTTPCKH
jgi:hypothetical protein